jgi:hypothetical protein
MAKKVARQSNHKPAYKYVITDMEAKYRMFMNPDKDKFTELNQRVKDNGGFCPVKDERTPANRCVCEQFKERDSEGFCKLRLYYKEARSEKDAEKFKNAEFTFNEKKEKEIEKEVEKELKKQEKLEAAIADTPLVPEDDE